jgi:hypothetical protein
LPSEASFLWLRFCALLMLKCSLASASKSKEQCVLSLMDNEAASTHCNILCWTYVEVDMK